MSQASHSTPSATTPWRMTVRGAFQPSWFTASQAEKDEVFTAWIEAHRRWTEMGCRLIVTLDDELSMVGGPRARLWNFYSVWEIPTPELVLELLNLFRVEDPEVIRLDRYFTLETIVGKPIASLERSLGGLATATAPK